MRSIHAQEKPYPPLEDVIKNQTKFEYLGVNGTIVGVWGPPFVGEMNEQGFHFHFISDDRTMGGHLLECDLHEGTVMIDDTPRVIIEMR